jgi:hypothetical protein
VFLANNLANNALFRNDGNFTFVKRTADTVSKEYGRSFSSAWSDVDNDGDLDLFVTNAFGPAVKRTNLFYLNNGSGTFTKISNSVITADSSWSYGCAFGDYDNDGFEDLAVATCRFGGTDMPDFLYHNNGNANKWITIKLQGTVSNRSAIGAKVRVKAIINGNTVWQLREISAQNAYCSQNDIRAHFGLGNASSVDSVKIEWPSGILQYSTGLNTNQFITIIESVPATSVQKNTAANSSLKISPNPSNGQLLVTLETGFSADDKILITDGNGRQVAEAKLLGAAKHYAFDLRKYNLVPGHYTITVLTRAGSFVQKMILSH